MPFSALTFFISHSQGESWHVVACGHRLVTTLQYRFRRHHQAGSVLQRADRPLLRHATPWNRPSVSVSTSTSPTVMVPTLAPHVF
jgi:hypothetical protein